MEIDKIKKYTKDRNESYICKISYLDKEYVQTIKLVNRKIKITYYRINNDDLIEEKNEEILRNLSLEYENTPNERMYRKLFFSKENTKKGKVEDEELREWTKRFSSDALESCKLFTDVYGKNFATKKMKNLESLYLEIDDGSVAGYQENKTITICKKTYYPASKYTIEEIKKADDMKQLLLHESVHLVLKDRLRRVKGITPTGMIRFIRKKDIYGNGKRNEWVEVGRGLNEGLTEWITEKCGYKEMGGYSNLTNFLRELELAIGPKKVMELGKGKNFEKILNVDEQTIYSNFMKADYIYGCERNIDNIIEYLKPIQTDNMEENEKMLYGNSKYLGDINGKQYQSFLGENNLQHSYENFLLYYREMENDIREEIETTIVELENNIFKQYFKNEIDFALSLEIPMTKKFILKYNDLREYLENTSFYCIERNGETAKFVNDLKIIKKKYCDSILEEAKENKNMTKSEFFKYFDELAIEKGAIKYKVFTDEQNELVDLKLNNLCKEDKWALKFLMKDLYHLSNLEEIDKYTIKKYISLNGIEEKLYYKDGKIVTKLQHGESKKITNENAKKYNEIFDFTIGMDEDFKRIITEFDQLREDLLDKDPQTEITILNRAILVKSNEKEKVFLISNGIYKAENVEEIKIDFSEEKEQNLQMIPVKKVKKKENFVERIWENLKEKFENKPQRGMILEEKIPQERHITSKEKRKQWMDDGIKVDKAIKQTKQEIKIKEQNFKEKDQEKY